MSGRRWLRCGVTALALLAGGRADAAGQGPVLGQRVRLEAPSAFPGRLEGLLVRLDGDSLGLRARGGDVRTVSLDAVAGLERFDGVGRRARRGALIGAAVVGAFVAQDMLRKPEQCRGSGRYGERCALVLTLSTVAGAGVGALVGAAFRHERWVPVSVRPEGMDGGTQRLRGSPGRSTHPGGSGPHR